MRAIAEDWITGLAEFPRWAIQEACTEYLNSETRKPTIAAIRDLTRAKMGAVSLMRVRAMQGPNAAGQPERDGPSPADQAERARIAAEVVGGFAARARSASGGAVE
jgi:hypothetical protein